MAYMQVPIGSYPRHEVQKGIENLAHGLALSSESQLKLKELYDYLDSCHHILSEIHRDLHLADFTIAGSQKLQKASEQLGKFCLKAEEWGFDSLSEVGQGLQMFLLNFRSDVQNTRFRETMDRGLAVLSALVEQCEPEFRWRLVIADTIEAFNCAAYIEVSDL
jgi:hypothetical protein